MDSLKNIALTFLRNLTNYTLLFAMQPAKRKEPPPPPHAF